MRWWGKKTFSLNIKTGFWNVDFRRPRMSASWSKVANKDIAYLVFSGPLSTSGDLKRCSCESQEQERLGKVYKNNCNTAEAVSNRSDKTNVTFSLECWSNILKMRKSHWNKWRKLQIASLANVSGLCAPSFASVEWTGCSSIEDTIRR